MRSIPLSPLQLLFHRFADELGSLVRACQRVNAPRNVLRQSDENRLGVGFLAERRASHAAGCARVQIYRQFFLRKRYRLLIV